MKEYYGNKELGNIIRKKRKNLDLTIAELAKILNVTPSRLTLWELGRRKIPNEYEDLLCNILDISQDEMKMKKRQRTILRQHSLNPVEVLKNKNFKKEERFDGEYFMYLKLIMEFFKQNGYELFAKKEKNRYFKKKNS